MTDLEGRLQAALGPAYRVEKELGGGGMSRVFLVEEVRLGRRVVAKVLPPEMTAGVSAERFEREILLAAKLQHPHIVPVLSAGSSDDLLYYIMPFIEGESLREKLTREVELPVDEALRIVRDVADALTYAHRHHLIHRDIKPENVLLSEGHALVTDFGVAKAVAASTDAELTSTGVAIGTPLYMAPEQAAADPHIDHRADIYALGAVAYEMLSGTPPFTGRTTQAVIAAHLTQAPEAITKRRPSVPEPINQVILRCLEKRPADRWQQIGDLMPHIEAVLTPSHETGRIAQPLHVSSDYQVRIDEAHPPRVGARFSLTALIILAIVATAYTTMRALGIGPFGAMVANGAGGERDPLVVADFENRTSDSALGISVTEALRVDLSQSPKVMLLDRGALTSALRRMGRDDASELAPSVAREIAEREQAKAFVAGEVAPLGTGFILSARVISTTSGETLVALRETATDQNQIISAVDRLSAKLRERLGESLRTIRASQPLDQVTTASIEALRRYSRASVVYNRGNYTEAIPLLEEALSADSTFAMAYRRLSVAYFTTGTQRARQIWAARKAFDYKNRLTPVEGYLAEGSYYDRVANWQKAIAAYKTVLEDHDPRNLIALINLALIYNQTRRYPEAEQLAVQSMRVADAAPSYAVAAYAQIGQGKFAAAESTVARFGTRLPTAPHLWSVRARFAVTKGDFAKAAMYYDSMLVLHRSASWRAVAQNGLADLALIRGKLAEAERRRREAMASQEARGALDGYLTGALHLAAVDLRHRKDQRAALAKIDAALGRHPLSTIPVIDRPYTLLAEFYAAAGRVAEARRMMTEYNNSVDSVLRREDATKHGAAGAIALAEGRVNDAAAAFRLLAGEGTGPFPGVAQLAELFDRAGNVDSALVYYRGFVDAHERFAATLLVLNDVAADAAVVIGPYYRRLGELHQQRGDRQQAIEYYKRFVDLWKEADPELQPAVGDVRQRLITLGSQAPH